jgi:hypothetical protein
MPFFLIDKKKCNLIYYSIKTGAKQENMKCGLKNPRPQDCARRIFLCLTFTRFG